MMRYRRSRKPRVPQRRRRAAWAAAGGAGGTPRGARKQCRRAPRAADGSRRRRLEASTATSRLPLGFPQRLGKTGCARRLNVCC